MRAGPTCAASGVKFRVTAGRPASRLRYAAAGRLSDARCQRQRQPVAAHAPGLVQQVRAGWPGQRDLADAYGRGGRLAGERDGARGRWPDGDRAAGEGWTSSSATCSGSIVPSVACGGRRCHQSGWPLQHGQVASCRLHRLAGLRLGTGQQQQQPAGGQAGLDGNCRPTGPRHRVARASARAGRCVPAAGAWISTHTDGRYRRRAGSQVVLCRSRAGGISSAALHGRIDRDQLGPCSTGPESARARPGLRWRGRCPRAGVRMQRGAYGLSKVSTGVSCSSCAGRSPC